MSRFSKFVIAALLLAVILGVFSYFLTPEREIPSSPPTARRLKRISPAKLGVRASRHVDSASTADHEPDASSQEDRDEIRLKTWEDFLEPYLEETGTNRAISVDEMIRTKSLFDALSEEQRNDEIGHTMNLIPDESVEILYGILFDPKEGAEIVDAIFSDLLNRDEDIKMPVLRQILKMKDHPCYEDAEHIHSVIGDDELNDDGDDDDDDDDMSPPQG